MTRLAVLIFVFAFLQTTGQVKPGVFVDTTCGYKRKCAEIILSSNSLFRFDLWDLNGNHWTSHQVINGIYSFKADTLILIDTMFTSDERRPASAAIRRTLFVATSNNLKYVGSQNHNSDKYFKELIDKGLVTTSGKHPLTLPALEPHGQLTRQK